MIIFRQASPDQPLIAALFEQADNRAASLYPDHDRSGTSAAQLIAQNVCFFVACDTISGALAGCGGYVPLPDLKAGEHCAQQAAAHSQTGVCLDAEIKRLFVNPRARRQGIARSIMTHIEIDAIRRGYQALYLETGVKSDAAIALYRSLGYVPCPPFGPSRKDVNSVFMAKTLSGSAQT
ncbi:GNAT family N-acetyltransferase [Thalassospira mesophila]|uniref:GNAT family N-acetyltransferase n=1 Tax=Thalassospira mesophila TaxID=1293891 RepID=UPI000A1FE1BD|nr:GNAT family N-acetyltransferase [Thalassospira mesophila]